MLWSGHLGVLAEAISPWTRDVAALDCVDFFGFNSLETLCWKVFVVDFGVGGEGCRAWPFGEFSGREGICIDLSQRHIPKQKNDHTNSESLENLLPLVKELGVTDVVWHRVPVYGFSA
ncbi:hypothetical protein L1049_019114 [Liquidambar formosana]|uniref:Uncharacterized protein n=1 Tax=Liquidambar formosana TaxID=63359 RepID=A0AAP0WPN1_LIQFO